MKNPIGIFDSGFGGLTVMKEIAGALPQYDFVYLGDNARAPYGDRSFRTVYDYTLQCVQWLFEKGCNLVILACNTASAKALRSIQQKDLLQHWPDKRVLGVIRPTTELIGKITTNGHVGIMGTTGTVTSESYLLEIEKFYPGTAVSQEACPMWVPLIENNEHLTEGADYFIDRHVQHLLKKDPDIDTILLACTHYPLMVSKIRKYVPEKIRLVEQGEIVANSLKDYLKRHPEMDAACSKQGSRAFFTTGEPSDFNANGTAFYGQQIESQHVDLLVGGH
jgi:glutamate racemase